MRRLAAWRGSDQLLEKARAVPILRIAEYLGLGAPMSRGKEWAVLCPFHDDHDPSCHLNVEKNVWYCFVCAEGGDGISLMQRARGLSLMAAARHISLIGS